MFIFCCDQVFHIVPIGLSTQALDEVFSFFKFACFFPEKADVCFRNRAYTFFLIRCLTLLLIQCCLSLFLDSLCGINFSMALSSPDVMLSQSWFTGVEI